jgi:hypothetical protein
MKATLRFVAVGLLGAMLSSLTVLFWLGAVADVVLLLTVDTTGWRALSHFAGAIWGIGAGSLLSYMLGSNLVTAIKGEKP